MGKEIDFSGMDLSSCEKMILGCVYEYHRKKEEAPNLRDIMELVTAKYGIEWKLQTICTFFSRMEKKGLLTILKKGRYSYYYPVVPYEVYVRYELGEVCKIYFENDIKLLKRFVRKL